MYFHPLARKGHLLQRRSPRLMIVWNASSLKRRRINNKRLETQAALSPAIKLELRENNFISVAQKQHNGMCPRRVLDVSQMCAPRRV